MSTSVMSSGRAWDRRTRFPCAAWRIVDSSMSSIPRPDLDRERGRAEDGGPRRHPVSTPGKSTTSTASTRRPGRPSTSWGCVRRFRATIRDGGVDIGAATVPSWPTVAGVECVLGTAIVREVLERSRRSCADRPGHRACTASDVHVIAFCFVGVFATDSRGVGLGDEIVRRKYASRTHFARG